MYFASTDKPKEKDIKISQENRVIVYVWKPKVDGVETTAKKVLSEVREARASGRRADANVGHVTMQTTNRYISIWPAESARGNHFKVVNAAYNNDFASDKDNEECEPGTIVTLYSLKIAPMERAFDDIKASDAGFVLSGDNSSVRSQNDRQGYNCNGLVYALLQIGGVDAITPFASESRFIGYISPDKFDSYIKEVKAKELSKYSDTQNYQKIPGEYVPKKKKTCVVQ